MAHITLKLMTDPDLVLERSQNTVLLASTQAVYKSPHSTVWDAVSQSVEPRTADQPVGSLRA